MLRARLLACIERRWREADILDLAMHSKSKMPWGGMNIIWMGDMLQLPPPSRFVRAIYDDCVGETRGGEDFNEDTDRLDGVRVFRQFCKMELTTQNRARRDREHKDRIYRMRTHVKPISDDLMKSLRVLSTDDMKDPKWRFAPIVVTTNIERHVINKMQAIRFARDKGLPVLTWVDPLANAPCDVDAGTDEKMDPSARRYFVLGAPAFIGENLNSAATGIVNGSPGWLHSLSWGEDSSYDSRQCAGSYQSGQLVEVPVPHTINVLRKNTDGNPGEIVPMAAKQSESEKGNATLKRLRHKVELGFCVTFHKIQGQTVERIILALHPRNSCQLLSMSFEMLYVAMTRVRRAENIRILRCPKAGLKHLCKLRRPACFDAWLAAYDEDGMWSGSELKRQADVDRVNAMKKLGGPKMLGKYTIAQMKPILAALGIRPKNAPDKNYPRRAQFREALYPAWVKAKAGRQKNRKSRYSDICVNSDSSGGPETPSTRKIKGDTDTPDRKRDSGGHDNTRRGNTGRRPIALWRDLTVEEQRIVSGDRRVLRKLRRNSSCDQDLRQRAWARDIPEVGYISRRDACAWARPGLMLNDRCLYAVAHEMSRGSECHVVDPQLVAHQHLIAHARLTLNVVDVLASGRVLALPYNDPRQHWWMVFLRRERGENKVKVTHRNSHVDWDSQAEQSCTNAIELFKRLVSNTTYNTKKHGPFSYDACV